MLIRKKTVSKQKNRSLKLFFSVFFAAVMLCTGVPASETEAGGSFRETEIYKNDFSSALSGRGTLVYGKAGRKTDDSSFCCSGEVLNEQFYTPQPNSTENAELIIRASFLLNGNSSDITFQPVSSGNRVFANMVIFTADGIIKTGAAKTAVGEYEENKWYQVTAAVNRDLSYELYVNGERLNTGGLKFSNNIKDTNTFDGISRIKMFSSGEIGEFFIDDFDFYIGAYDPSISASKINFGITETEGIPLSSVNIVCSNEYWFYDVSENTICENNVNLNENIRVIEKAEDGITFHMHVIPIGFGNITFGFDDGAVPWNVQPTEKAGTKITFSKENENGVLKFSGVGSVKENGKTEAGDSYVSMPYVSGDYEFEVDVKNLYPENADAQLVLRDTRNLSMGDGYIILAKIGGGSNKLSLFPSVTSNYIYDLTDISWHHVKVKVKNSVITVKFGNIAEAVYDCGDMLFDFGKYCLRLQATVISKVWTENFINTVYYDNLTVPGRENEILSFGFYRRAEDSIFPINILTEGIMGAAAEISVWNDSLKSLCIVTAAYENEKLKNIGVSKVYLKYGANRLCSEIKVESAENTEVKAFLFDGLDSVKPAAESIFAKKGLIENVTPLEILSDLRQEHPRIIADGAAFEKMAALAETNAVYREFLNKFSLKTENYVTANMPVYEKSDGLRLGAAYTTESALLSLMFMYKISDDERYAEKAAEYIENAINFPDWNTSHFLDTAALSGSFAIAYDWGFNYFDAELKVKMAEAMVNFALKPALARYKNSSYGWNKMDNNWNAVCNCGIGNAALAIAEEYPELCGEILAYSIDSLQYFTAAFEPDGGWYEGYGYWNYGITNFCAQAAALESATGKTYGIMNENGIKKTAYYPLYIQGATEISFNYADGNETYVAASPIAYFGKYYGDVNLIDARIYKLKKSGQIPGWLDMIWLAEFEERLEQNVFPSLELMKHFKGDETLTMRSAWNDGNALFAGLHGGKVDVNHGQMDKGQFIFEAEGIRWAIDLGSDNYNLYNYFDNSHYRWYYYRNRAEGHNTLVINPAENPIYQQRLDASAVITETSESLNVQTAVMDLSEVYGNDVNCAKRGIKLDSLNRYFVVQDEFELKNSTNEIYWFMHTKANITIAPNGKSALLTSGGKNLYVQILGATETVFTKEKALPLEVSPNPDLLEQNINNTNNNPTEQNKNNGVEKLCIHETGVPQGNHTISVALYPLEQGETYPSKAAVFKPISDW